MEGPEKLTAAMKEILAVIRSYDIGASIILHTPGYREYVNALEPSYSVMKFNNGELRIRSKLSDYQGNKDQQLADLKATVNMVVHMMHATSHNFVMFEGMLEVLKEYMDIENTQEVATHDKDGFEMVRHPKSGAPGILCLTCNRTSFNTNDINNKYCGHCHKFHNN